MSDATTVRKTEWLCSVEVLVLVFGGGRGGGELVGRLEVAIIQSSNGRNIFQAVFARANNNLAFPTACACVLYVCTNRLVM